MQNFAKALWNVLKQYKEKLMVKLCLVSCAKVASFIILPSSFSKLTKDTWL
jgi:hypothetical protein